MTNSFGIFFTSWPSWSVTLQMQQFVNQSCKWNNPANPLSTLQMQEEPAIVSTLQMQEYAITTG
jgi:hypothetical protein